MKKNIVPKPSEPQKLKGQTPKRHSFFSPWGLAVIVLIIGGVLIAFDYIPIAEYLRFNKEEDRQEILLEQLQQDIQMIREELQENQLQIQQLSLKVQEEGPEKYKEVKDSHKKACWIILLNRLHQKLQDGQPFDKLLSQLEVALAGNKISVEPLKVFAAEGVPSDESLSEQLIQKPTPSEPTVDLWGRFLSFVGRLISIKKIDASVARQEAYELLQAHKLSQALDILRSQLPENQQLIRQLEQKLEALKNLEDIEFFIISNLQESHVL